MIVADSAIRPSRLLAAKDDREQFVRASETTRRELPVSDQLQTLDSAEQDSTDDVDDDDKVSRVF